MSVWLREHGCVEMVGSDVPGEDSEANEKGLCASLGGWTSPCEHRASPRSSQMGTLVTAPLLPSPKAVRGQNLALY